MKYTAILLLTILLFANCNVGELENAESIETSTESNESIETRVQKALSENNIPSLSIGVIKEGKIIVLKGFGQQSRNNSTKVDEKAMFQIASQSKMFTGIIINHLLQEGKLNLEEPITSYLPAIEQEAAREAIGKIKLKFLLNHTAGIPSDACSVYSERVEGEAWTKGYTKEELLADLNKIELEFEPGSQFQYSNSGYAVVGYIAEQVSGLSYEQLLKKYVTEKYQLANTVVTLDAQQKNRLVTPYKKDQRMIATEASWMGLATPASAIYSNATDLTHLLLQ